MKIRNGASDFHFQNINNLHNNINKDPHSSQKMYLIKVKLFHVFFMLCHTIKINVILIIYLFLITKKIHNNYPCFEIPPITQKNILFPPPSL